MPQDPVYEQHYGLRGLFASSGEDAAQHPDTWTSATAPGRGSWRCSG